MNKRYGDIIAGSLVVIFAIFIFISSFGIKMLTASRIGSAFVPQITAVLLGITGLFLLVKEVKILKATNLRSGDTHDTAAKEPKRIGRVITTLLVLTVYILLLEKIGFILMTAFYLFAQCAILADKSERKVPLFITVALVLAVGIYFLFVNVFQLILPSGILG